MILTQSSIELAVDEYATDVEVVGMGKDDKKDVWGKAKNKAVNAWQSKMVAQISIQLARAHHVPLRFVKRGAERFYDL